MRINLFETSTIKSKLIRYFCISVLVPLIISSALNYTLLSINLGKNASSTYSEILLQTNENLDLVMKNIESIATGVSFNAEIQDILYNKKFENLKQDYMKQKVIDVLLGNFKLFYNIVGNIVLFSADGSLVTSLEGYRQDINIKAYKWYETAANSQGENIWVPTHTDAYDFVNYDQKVISLAKKIRKVGENTPGEIGKEIGYLLINVKENRIHDVLSRVRYGNTGSLFIVDSQSKIVSHKDKNLIGSDWVVNSPKSMNNDQGSYFTTIDQRDVLVNYCTSAKTGWKLVGIINKREIMKDSTFSFIISISISVILFIVFVFLSILLSNSISAPIRELRYHMKEVERGKLEQNIKNEYKIDEIKDLITSFNGMVYRLNKLINEVYNAKLKEKELEAAARQAELNALQQQINPHFLYNTLDSINWMAQLSGSDEIANMVTALGDFFRTSINKGFNFISIYLNQSSLIVNSTIRTGGIFYVEKSHFHGTMLFVPFFSVNGLWK